MSQETDPTFSGMVRLYAPYGASVNGVRYFPDANDIIVVPSADAVDLLSFPPICPEASRPLPEADDEADLSRQLALGHDAFAKLQDELIKAFSDIATRDKRIAVLEAHSAVEPPKPAAHVAVPTAKPTKP